MNQQREAKQSRRPHFLREWLARRDVTQAELARQIQVDKSLVSRWLAGSTPSVEHQSRLAAFFECGRDGLFRHPNQHWISNFLEGRSKEEIERIKATLEAAFPRR